MKKFLLLFILSLLLAGFTFDLNKPLTSRFLLSQSILNGEAVKFNGNVFVITGGINRGLTATQITL